MLLPPTAQWFTPMLAATRLSSTLSRPEQVTFAAPSPVKAHIEGELDLGDFVGYADAVRQLWAVPGLSIAAVRVNTSSGDSASKLVGLGQAGRGRAVTADTSFNIGSNTKLFTTLAVATLVDEGRFDWTSKIADLIPGLEFFDKVTTKEASLVELLSHTTGLPRHEFSYHWGESLKEIVRKMEHLRPSQEFRETWQYNNMPFMLAAHLVTLATNTSFTSYVTERLLEPLNLTSTTFVPDARVFSDCHITLWNGTNVAIPYEFAQGSDNDLQMLAGPGGITSTARDMAKWVEYLIRAHQDASSKSKNNKGPVSATSIRHITAAHAIANRQLAWPELGPALYGQGLAQTSYRGHQLYLHGGSIPGFGSQIMWIPASGIGVAIMCNTEGTGNVVADVLSYRVLDTLLGLPPIDWLERYSRSPLRGPIKTSPAYPGEPDESKQPTLPSRQYEGTFFNAAYSNITVCPSEHNAPQSVSIECKKIWEETKGAVSGMPFGYQLAPAASGPDSVVLNGAFGFLHAKLIWAGEDVWTVVPMLTYPPVEGYERKTPLQFFLYAGPAIGHDAMAWFKVEDDKVKSVAFMGVWGAGLDVPFGEKEVEFRRVV